MKKKEIKEALRRYIAEQREKTDTSDFTGEYLRSSWAFGAIDFALHAKLIDYEDYKELGDVYRSTFE